MLLSFHSTGRPSVNFRHFPCHRRTFRQLSLTFHLAGRLPLISVWSGDFLSTSPAIGRPSVNILCGLKTFHEYPSTFHAARRHSVIFHHFLCGCETFRQLASIFHNARRHAVNLCQPSVRPEKLLSTFCDAGRLFVNFCQLPCGRETVR